MPDKKLTDTAAGSAQFAVPTEPHTMSGDEVLSQLNTSPSGLSELEAAQRLSIAGRNTFPRVKLPGLFVIFLRQFRNPMIYILLVAAIVSVVVREYSDAVFILIVLLLNAVIGAAQEHSAQQSASALRDLVTHIARVERQETLEVDAEELVPGDIVLLESGDKVPADLRLISVNGLQVD